VTQLFAQPFELRSLISLETFKLFIEAVFEQHFAELGRQ
jgi:hypothetical protein